MNIDRIQSQLIRLYGGRTQGARGGDKSAESDSTEQGARTASDGFVLSEEASSVRRMVTVVAQAPDLRGQLVNELHSQVQAGSYAPNDEAVAQALLKAESGA